MSVRSWLVRKAEQMGLFGSPARHAAEHAAAVADVERLRVELARNPYRAAGPEGRPLHVLHKRAIARRDKANAAYIAAGGKPPEWLSGLGGRPRITPDVKQPGTRGGNWRLDRHGHVRYDRPAPPKPFTGLQQTLDLVWKPRPDPATVTAIAVAVGPQPDPKRAAKLRKTADGMQERIDYCFHERLANTARRRNIAGGMYSEGERLQRMQGLLRNLADAAEEGTLAPELGKVTNVAQIEELLAYKYVKDAKDPVPADWPECTVSRQHLKLVSDYAREHGIDKVDCSIADRVLFRSLPPWDTCETCGGTGDFVKHHSWDEPDENGDCPACHGKGKIVGEAPYTVNVTEMEWNACRDLARAIIKAPHKGWEWHHAEYLLNSTMAHARARAMGLDSQARWQRAQEALRELRPGRRETPAQRQIRELEGKLFGYKIPGYFPTPKTVAERLVDLAEIGPGMLVLEPSAGKGNIAEVIRAKHPDAGVWVVESNHSLFEILELKGFGYRDNGGVKHGIYNANFLAFNPVRGMDRIVMNPPFEDGQDVEHVRHAFDLLKPGGRLVAIMGEHGFFASDKRSEDFRDWLDEHEGTSEKLPAGSFMSSDRPTGVACRVVVLDKPAKVVEAPVTKAYGDEHRLDYWNRPAVFGNTPADLMAQLAGYPGGVEAATTIDYFREHPGRVGAWERALIVEAEDRLADIGRDMGMVAKSEQLGLFRPDVQEPGKRGGHWHLDKRGKVRYGTVPTPEARNAKPDDFDAAATHGLNSGLTPEQLGVMARQMEMRGKTDAAEGYRHAQLRRMAERAAAVEARGGQRPHPTWPMVVSYGGGVDSTAMLIEMARRGIRPDAITFADVGGEWPETYAFLGAFEQWLESHGMPPITVVRYVPKTAPYDTLEGNCIVNETVPGILTGRKSCSKKWKQEPQIAWVKAQQFAQDAFAAGHGIVRAIGFESEETQRTFPGEGKGEEPWYPLQDWNLNREQCKKIITDAGLALPATPDGKSACWFCPMMRKEEVFELAKRHPELAARCIAMEDVAKSGKHPLRNWPGLLKRGRKQGWTWRSLLEGNPEVMARLAEIAPERKFGSVISFHSGSTAPSQFRGFAMANAPVGVVATITEHGRTRTFISPRVEDMIAEYTDKHGRVFVDSGAFPAFKRGESVNFTTVFAAYDRLLNKVKNKRRLYMVAPDVVGKQAESLGLQRTYAQRIRGYINQGVRMLVPIQVGSAKPSAVYEQLKRLLGTNDFSVAVPSNEEAFSMEDLRDLASARPGGIHLLGIGTKQAKLAAMVNMIRELSPQTSITTDANRLRAWVGRKEGVRVVTRNTDKLVEGSIRGWETLAGLHSPEAAEIRETLANLPEQTKQHVRDFMDTQLRPHLHSFAIAHQVENETGKIIRKAHVRGYTRGGSYVQPHEARRSTGYAGGHWQVSRCNNREECGGYVIGHGAGQRCPRCFAPTTLQAGGGFFTEEGAERYVMEQPDAFTKGFMVTADGRIREGGNVWTS